MSEKAANMAQEIAALERKSDQACTIHALLRDRNRRKAGMLDYGLLAGTTYLLGLSLVEPAIGIPLNFGLDPQLLIALFSLGVFFLSIVQFKNDWKTNAEAHHRSMKEYADIKSSCRVMTSGTRSATSAELYRLKSRYGLITEVGTHIPDGSFVVGKAHHVRKVFVSRYLDDHPGARPWLIHVKLFLRDNFNIDLLDHDDKTEP